MNLFILACHFLFTGIYLHGTFYSQVYANMILFIYRYIGTCMHYYIACAKLVLALLYCNFLREVRLGGWGTEGPKAPTLGQYVRVRAQPFR